MLIKKIYQVVISFYLAFAVVGLVYAKDQVSNNEALRKVFKSAEKFVWQADSPQFKKLYQQLNNYPLQPYLIQKHLLHKLSLKKTDQIERFLRKYKGTPLDWPLRKQWLKYLAKKQRKWMYLNYYRPNSDAELTCYYYRFQLDTGTPAIVVLPQVTSLWLVGKSQPKVCDPLFKRWQQAGYRTANVIWQRVALAAQGGKHTLIPYLTKLLPKQDQPLARLWHKVRRDPAYVRHLTKFPKQNKKSVEILTYGLKRFIWRDPALAQKVYKKALKRFTFSEQQQLSITKKFAKALASKNKASAQYWLDKIPANKLNDDLIQWQLAHLLQQNNWQKIKQGLRKLPIEFHHKLQWKYWYARSLLQTNEQALAKTLLSKIAQKRHYYGFLAASLISKPISLQHQPLFYRYEARQKILQNPAAQRAFELFYLKRFNLARREWQYWLTQLSSEEKLIASLIAHTQGWFDRAIFTLAQQGYLDDVNLRFPKAYHGEINRYAKKHNVPAYWAFAIARRESSFMSDAHSGAGAYGLMQILPSTAKQLLRKKVPYRYLFNVKNNIKLGTKYLRLLLTKQHHNIVLATASYNAGPYRVNTWLKNKSKLAADVWIETIPYKETRDYVKSVLAYAQIYQYRDNPKQQAIFTQLTRMKIGQ